MGWRLEQLDDGRWEWFCWQSAFGAVGGVEDTLVEAKIEMAIAEAAITESPLGEAMKTAMRADPERFAADYPDPDGGDAA